MTTVQTLSAEEGHELKEACVANCFGQAAFPRSRVNPLLLLTAQFSLIRSKTQ